MVRGTTLRVMAATAFVVANLAWIWAGGAHIVHQPFNSAPEAFIGVSASPDEPQPATWNRLLVSRWDSGRFIRLARVAYDGCPPKRPLTDADLAAYNPRCELQTFPTYAMLGRLLCRGLGWSIDTALFGIAVASSFVLAWLWTSPSITPIVGKRTQWISLLVLATFPSAFYLVSIYSESLTLALLVGGFVAFRKRAWALSGLLVGAATGIRHTAVGAAVGLVLALAMEISWRRVHVRDLLHRLLAMLLSGWGFVALSVFWWRRFGDPFVWKRGLTVGRPAISVWETFSAVALFRGFRTFQYEAAIAVMVGLLALVGMGAGRYRLRNSERVILACHMAVAFGLPFVNAMNSEFWGFNRYWLLVLPVFFAVARAFERNVWAAGGWIGFSLVYGWYVELCFHLTRNQAAAPCPCLHL